MDKYCDKCKPLRGAEPSLLAYCEHNSCKDLPMIGGVSDGQHTVTVTYLCHGHAYDFFGLCAECFHFVQDPHNDEAIKRWEQNVERLSVKSATA